MKKRFISLLLIFFLVMSIVPPIQVRGATDGGKDISNNVRLFGNIIKIFSDAVAGNSGIKYRTIGYKASVIIDKTYSYILDYNQLNDNNLREYTIPFTKDESADVSIRNRLIEKYPSDAAKINEYWKTGGRIYMDAIMVITLNGERQGSLNGQSYSGRVYDTANGIINAQYQYNGKWYTVNWHPVTVKELPSHFGWIDFTSQSDYMEEDKNPAIDVDFDLLPKVMEYQDIGFKDKTTATDTEITNWRAVVTKVGGGSGAVYPNKELAEKDLANGLPEGEYKVTVYADDKENASDDDYVHDQDEKTIIVIKPDPLIAIAIEKAKDSAGNKVDTVEIGQTFTVTAEDSAASKGAKVVEWKHFVSVGDSNNFNQVSDQKEFQAVYNVETLLYYYVQIKDTAGIEATSSVITLKVTDNSPSLADAEIYSPGTYYEGLFETVGNWSTFEYKGDTYSASEASKKGIGSSSWKFQDLDLPTGTHGRLGEAKHEKEDWKSSEGGRLRFFEVGNKQLWLQARGKGSVDIDTNAVSVIALPKAAGEIIGSKKNREIYIYNKSLFKPRDAWQTGENGEIDNSKTKITITNLETGQVATSTAGAAFNSTFVKGVSTEFAEVDEGDYTHKKNDITKVVFVGDDESDQKTERFKIQVQVTDKRGNTDTWEEIRTIFGDQKPVAYLKGLFSYIRNPVTKSAYTDIEVYSYSPDMDVTENKVKLESTGAVLPITGERKKVDFNPNKTGNFTLKVNIIERFINFITSALRGFFNSNDEKQDNKDYVVKVDNIAPVASFSAIKPSYINMQTFIDNKDITNFDNEMTTFVQNMANESISINNVQSSFIDEDGWFNVTDKIAMPVDMVNDVNVAKSAGKRAFIAMELVNNKYFHVGTIINSSGSNNLVKHRVYDLATKALLHEQTRSYYASTFNSSVVTDCTPLEKEDRFIILDKPVFYANNVKIIYYSGGTEYSKFVSGIYGSTSQTSDFFVDGSGDMYLYQVYWAGSSNGGWLPSYSKINTSIPYSQYSTGLQSTVITADEFNREKSKLTALSLAEKNISLIDPDVNQNGVALTITYEDADRAYYQIRGGTDTNPKLWVKEYNKKTNTVNQLFYKDSGFNTYATKPGANYVLQNLMLTTAVVKGQIIVAMSSVWKTGDHNNDTLDVLHFNGSGSFIKKITYASEDSGYGYIRAYHPDDPVLTVHFATDSSNQFYGGYYNVDTRQSGTKYYSLRADEAINNKYFCLTYFASNSGYKESYVYNYDGTQLLQLGSYGNYIRFVPFPEHLRNTDNYRDYVFYIEGSKVYSLHIPTNTKTFLFEDSAAIYLSHKLNGSYMVKGDYLYVHYINSSNTPIIRRINFKTGVGTIINSQVYNVGDFRDVGLSSYTNTVQVYTNPFNEVKEYWGQETSKNSGYLKIRYSEKIVDSLEKFKTFPSANSQDNILPIITSKKLDLDDNSVAKIIDKVNEINTLRTFEPSKKIKIMFLDIGGNNAVYGQILATQTGGQYYNCSNAANALTQLGNYVRTKATPTKGTNTINIKVGDTITLQGTALDYEGDPIILEQYRSQGKAWGAFATGIQNLGSNRLKFTQQGTFILQYQVKDNPPTVNIDTSKFSNIAQLTVIVGDGSIIDPPTPLPPNIGLTIKGSKVDGSCVERHRVDFLITGFEGINPIDWSTLNIQFNQTDHLPNVKPTLTGFSRIFTRVDSGTQKHSVTITLKDTAGLTTTETFEFVVGVDQVPSPGFTLSGDGYRNNEGVAVFKLTENISSADDQIGSVEYLTTATKYTLDSNGNVVPDGTLEYPLILVGDKLMLSEVGTKQIKQLVTEYYENGSGLDGVDLDAEGYRVFKTALAYQYPEVKNIAPELTYSVEPSVILKGSSVSHALELVDDTELGDTVKYRFTHSANLQNSDGVHPQHNSETDEPITKLDYKGLYTFLAQATDEDGDSTGLVNGGQVKVVSEPIADFELYSNPAKNDGENLEYQDDTFKAGSIITLKNLSSNPDYGLTREDHGLEYMKVEYKKVGDTNNYTTVFERSNMSDYKYELDLPIENERSKYEVKLTVRSIDGFENTIVKQFTLLELRLDAELEPSTIYASQSYKIKAAVSKDCDGVVAKNHNGNWVTLDKVREDTESLYFEKEVTTLDTLLDGSYPIEVYSMYPFGNEVREDLTLTVNTPLNLTIELTPAYPDSIPASESITVAATTECPIDVDSVTVWLEDESELQLTKGTRVGDGTSWFGTYPVRATKPDRDYYSFYARAAIPTGKEATVTVKVKVETPINLVPAMPDIVVPDDSFSITATTTKYAGSCRVTLFKDTEFEETLTLSGVQNGDIKNWKRSHMISEEIPEGTYVAQFRATTPNGNVETKNVSFRVETLQVNATLVPNPALAGDELIFTVDTKGFVDTIEIFVDPDIIAKDDRVGKYTYPLRFNVNGSISEKTDVLRYILCVWTDKTLTKDNVRLRPEYTFIVRGYRGEQYKEVELKLDIRRSVLELIHPGVKTN